MTPLHAAWNRDFAKLREYKAQFGHCAIPQGEIEFKSLFDWVSTQRARRKRGGLTDVQISNLDKVGMDWTHEKLINDGIKKPRKKRSDSEPSRKIWDGHFNKLVEFNQRYGHLDIKLGEDNDELKPLAQWASAVISQGKAGLLSQARMDKLNSIGFIWNWQSQKSDSTWMNHYEALEKYFTENGNPNMPKTHENTVLANWIWIQRQRNKRRELTVVQINLLNKLNFRWDARADKWLDQLELLKEFKLKFGHCNVELDASEHKTLKWVNLQRKYKADGSLEPWRANLLNEIGLVWHKYPLTEHNWQSRFEQLKQYLLENSDDPSILKDRVLSRWASLQRYRFKTGELDSGQIDLLNEVGFVWKFRDRGCWEDRLNEVDEFVKNNNHGKIPLNISHPPKLGAFVNAMRTKKNSGILSADRIAKLNAVGFDWGSGARAV